MFPAGVFPSDYYHAECQIIKGCLLHIEVETIYQSRWSVPKALYFYVSILYLPCGTTVPDKHPPY
jgi:hypothetical protein